MSIRLPRRYASAASSLDTTLTLLAGGDGVHSIKVATPSDLYLVYDQEGALEEGDAVPANAAVLPAGVQIVSVRGTGRPFLAAVTGTVLATFLALPVGALASPGSVSVGAGGGGSGPTPDAEYVVLSPDAGLPNARTLAVSAGLSVVDGGAGSTATVTLDAGLQSLRTVDTAADLLPYTSGANAWASTALSSFARSYLDDTSASAFRTTTGTALSSAAFLCAGVDVALPNSRELDVGSGLGITDGGALSTFVITLDAGLVSLTAVDSAADRYGYTTGADTWASGTITSFGRSLIDDVAASNARTTLGLVPGTDVQAWDPDLDAVAALSSTGVAVRSGSGTWTVRTITAGASLGVTNGDGVSGNPTIAVTDAELVAIAGLTSAADKLTYWTGSGTASLADLTSFGRSLIDDSSSSAARTTLGVVIGTDVQAQNPNLAAIAGLTTAANKLVYWTGSGTAALADLTSFARTILDDADAATVRATLGITAASSVYIQEAEAAGLTLVAPSQDFQRDQSAGSWTTVFDHGSVSPTKIIVPEGIEITWPGPSGTKISGFTHGTFPSGDFLISFKVNAKGPGAANSRCGLWFMESSTNTADLYEIGFRMGTTGNKICVSLWSAYSLFTSDAYISGSQEQNDLFVQVSYQASTHTVTVWAGMSASSVYIIETRVLAFTPTVLGLLGQGINTSAANMTVTSIRVTADAYAITIPPLRFGAKLAA